MNTVGCFGSVVYFNAESRRCGACKLKESCATKVETNRAELAKLLQTVKASDRSSSKARKRAVSKVVSELTTSNPASDASATHATTTPARKGSDTSGLNVKAAEFVNRWESKGLDFTAYKRGENPFTMSGNKFAVVAMEFLMRQGSCTRMEMVDHLIANAGGRGPWGCGTASSHANIVFEAFAHLGIVTVSGGSAYLVR